MTTLKHLIGAIPKQKKQQLRAKYETLNPAALKRKIARLQERLLKTTSSSKRLPARARKSSPAAATTTRRSLAKQ